MQSINQKIPLNVFITSILLALFADTKILNLIVLAAYPFLAGTFMTVMYVFVVISLFFMGIIYQRHSLLGFSLSHLGICILCIVWYLFTYIFIGQPSVSIQFFGIFTVAAFLIPGIIKIDVRTFLMALMMLPSVGMFYLEQIFLNEILEEGVVSMGTCYAFLIPVLANLVYLRFFFAKESLKVKTLMLVFAGINFFYLFQMAMFGSRGPILCAVLLLICFFIFKINDGSITIRRGRAFVCFLIAIVVTLFFVSILKTISNYLEGFDISLNVVDKFLNMDDRGDMSNGRDDIEIVAWKGIGESILIGHGTAQFERNTDIVYPHNFILQLLYDGGFILASLVLIPILKSAIIKVKRANFEVIICLMFFFFSSVPGALFSGDLWQSGTLWMFFGFVLSKKTPFKYQKK